MQVTPLEFIIAPYVLEQQFSWHQTPCKRKLKFCLLSLKKELLLHPDSNEVEQNRVNDFFFLRISSIVSSVLYILWLIITKMELLNLLDDSALLTQWGMLPWKAAHSSHVPSFLTLNVQKPHKLGIFASFQNILKGFSIYLSMKLRVCPQNVTYLLWFA